jgi:hypothetical protein
MKLNHFKCPTCGHDWYEDGAYGTCDACQTFFYVYRPDYADQDWPAKISISGSVETITGGYWYGGHWVPFDYILVS